MAVDEGYDRVAFVNGKQSVERYDLSKEVARVAYFPNARGVGAGTFIAWPKSARGGPSVIEHDDVKPDQLEDLIGKEVARKLWNNQSAPTGRMCCRIKT